jgi:hypothetical protein
VLRMFHVTSTVNRQSIMTHGLDWTRMGAARGIAGSREPEEDGIFVCPSEFDAEFFVRMNGTDGPVDVWAIDGIDPEELVPTDAGFTYVPARISPERLTLVDRAAVPRGPAQHTTESASTYGSQLTITWDGTTTAG